MRLIDADNILDFIDNAIKTAHGIGLRPAAALCLKKRIEDEPTIDPVRHGRWVGVTPLTDSRQCSVCGFCIYSEELETPYCGWCGARMEESE